MPLSEEYSSTKQSLEKYVGSSFSESSDNQIECLLEHQTLRRMNELPRLKSRLWISQIGNVILLALSAALSLESFARKCNDPSLNVWSPANSAVQWVDLKFQAALGQPTEYMGFPDDETDKRWEALFQYNTSVITKKEAQRLITPTMVIPGTDQYLIELEVFHNLHCVNELRKMLYPERYGLLEHFRLPDGSINRTSFGYKHWEHCVDSLRQALMCNADISPISYHVNVPFNRGIYPRLATTHSCRDFSQIQDWARSHRAPPFETRIYNFTRLQEIIDDTDIDHSTEEDLQSSPDLFPGDEYFHYWREHEYKGEALRPQIYPTREHTWKGTLWG